MSHEATSSGEIVASLGEGAAAAVCAVGRRAVGAVAVGVAVAAGREAGLLRQPLGQLLGVGQAVLARDAQLPRRRVRLGVREVELLRLELLRARRGKGPGEEEEEGQQREGRVSRHSSPRHSHH